MKETNGRNGGKSASYSWAVEKHHVALAGTEFEKCAPCSGCGGKVEADGEHMKCSRCEATPVPITEEQAKQCDGTKPSPFNRKNHSPRHRI